MGSSAAQHPVDDGVVLNLRIRLGPSQRASSWLSGAEIHPAPSAAFNICDGGDAIGCAYVAKLTLLGTSWIDVHASAGAYGQKDPMGQNLAMTLWIGMEHSSFNRVCAFASRAVCAPPGSF